MLKMTTRNNTKIDEILWENEKRKKVDPIMKEFESDLGEASD